MYQFFKRDIKIETVSKLIGCNDSTSAVFIEKQSSLNPPLDLKRKIVIIINSVFFSKSLNILEEGIYYLLNLNGKDLQSRSKYYFESYLKGSKGVLKHPLKKLHPDFKVLLFLIKNVFNFDLCINIIKTYHSARLLFFSSF